MAIEKAAADIATSSLQSLPFGNIIGGPLIACVEAQAQAARTSWEFIQNVGLYKDGEETKTVNVAFQFIKEGRMAQITLPLLTIVPIPYIAINSIDINFKASISASAASTETENSASSGGGNVSVSAGCLWARGKMNASYSSKKDSSATKDSKYSVEYTMDVAVRAGQESMPAGMAKVLEMLNNSICVTSPAGELTAEFEIGENGAVKVMTSYKNKNGLCKPEKIKLHIGSETAADFDSTAENASKIQKTETTKEYALTQGADPVVCFVTAGTCTKKIVIPAKAAAAATAATAQ